MKEETSTPPYPVMPHSNLTRFVYLYRRTLTLSPITVRETTSIMFRFTGSADCTQVMNNVVNGFMHPVMN